jgi:flagellar basal-body rod protein FlgF
MIRGLYTATTGMIVERQKMDVLTNNIVNADTTGYKSDTLMTSAFNDQIIKRINDPNVSIVGTSVGKYSFGSHVDEMSTDFSQGTLEDTGRSTDLALSGDGFFAVETPQGERYTRAGNFSVDSQGYLVTADGNYVLGQNGRIRTGGTNFTVAADGTISGNGMTDRLRLVTFNDKTVLRKQGGSLYYVYGDAAPQNAANCGVRQGAQEVSNVSAADSMVDMLSIYRKYEACQKAVRTNDETLDMASKLGKLGG